MQFGPRLETLPTCRLHVCGSCTGWPCRQARSRSSAGGHAAGVEVHAPAQTLTISVTGMDETGLRMAELSLNTVAEQLLSLPKPWRKE